MHKIFSIFIVLIIIALGVFLYTQGDLDKDNMNITTPEQNEIKVTPIEHATLMLEWGDKVIYADPVGDAELFAGLPAPDLILLTDTHGDHLDINAINRVTVEKTILVAPQAVFDQIIDTLEIGTLVLMNNGDKSGQAGFTLEAIPMYNIPESPKAFHVKGRGNGYVIERGDKRVYIAGDTADTPELRGLSNIYHAFVPMNLPYTMTVEAAADGVLEMRPERVTPYHYRSQGGLSDINKFRDLVNAGDPNIIVDLMNFYPN